MGPAQESLEPIYSCAHSSLPLMRQLGLQLSWVWGRGSGLDSVGGDSKPDQRPSVPSEVLPLNWRDGDAGKSHH